MRDITKHSEYFNIDFRYPNEVFKKVSEKVPNYKNYEISNYGRIISYAKSQTIILRQSNGHLGYKVVKLGWNNLWHVAKITLITWISNPENKPCCNHLNGIKYDNRVANLEWCTPKENSQHAIRMGLINRVNYAIRKPLTNEEIYMAFEDRKNGMSMRAIAKKQNRVYRTIRDLLNGKTNKKRAKLAKKKMLLNLSKHAE